MSLRRMKTLYCVAVIAVSIMLANVGSIVYWLAAVTVLAGALPVFRAIQRIGAFHEKQRTLAAVTDLLVQSHPDSLQSGRVALDRQTTEQSAEAAPRVSDRSRRSTRSNPAHSE